MTVQPPAPRLRPTTHAIYFEMTASASNVKHEILIIGPTPSIPCGYGAIVRRRVTQSAKGHWNVSTYMNNHMQTIQDPSRGGKLFFSVGPRDTDPLVQQLSHITTVLGSTDGVLEWNETWMKPLVALMQVSVSEFLELGWQADPSAGANTPYKLLSRAQDIYDGLRDGLPGTASTAHVASDTDVQFQEWIDLAGRFTYKYDRRSEVNIYLGYLLAGAFCQEIFDSLDEQVPPIGRLGPTFDGLTPNKTREEPTTMNEYTRPNGEIYYSRVWTGIEDVEVLRTARTHKQYPLLYGPPGTGKTALTEAAFGPDLITIMITGDTEVSDLVGQFIPNPRYGEPGDTGGEYLWIDGKLTQAVEQGRPCLLDEIGLGDPKVLSVLYPLMDGRDELHVTTNPDRGVVPAAEGFFLIGATNPDAPGVQMSEALLSRFNLHVEVQTDWALAITTLGVPEAITGLAQGLSKMMMNGETSWAPQMRELLTFKHTKELYGEKFALANLLASCPEEDRALVQERARRLYKEEGVALPARIGPS